MKTYEEIKRSVNKSSTTIAEEIGIYNVSDLFTPELLDHLKQLTKINEWFVTYREDVLMGDDFIVNQCDKLFESIMSAANYISDIIGREVLWNFYYNSEELHESKRCTESNNQ